MRGVFGAMAIAIVVSFAGSAGAATSQTAAVNTTSSTSKNIIVAQRCRCVERRWNGSCKLRVCRDHW